MKIYTKTGDDGTTGLFNGQRVSKSDLRVETYGTIDELNSLIGIVTTLEIKPEFKTHLQQVSRMLFRLGSDLATPIDGNDNKKITRINKKDVDYLENLIDLYDEVLPKLTHFILPGGSTPSAFLHNARTVCRRAERCIVALSNQNDIGEWIEIFINRLSDYLFTAARYANYLSGIPDVIWNENE